MSIKRKSEGLKVYGKRARRQLPNNPPMFFPPSNQVDTSQQPPPLPPNKPAFKMTVDPAEETIQNLINFCNELGSPITRENAIRYLKVKNNDVNEAFTAFFSNEDISAQESATQWDENAWSQGKEGPGAGGGDGMNDPHLRPLLSSSAPTRNNSPARNSLHPTSKQQEDEDLAKAMAASQGNEYFQQQESGIMGAAGQETQFGPANRHDYNPMEWAMVPTGPTTSGEVVPDAEVEERVGKAGEPRMLKHVPGGGEYVANLLTILANVYGAREAMLMRGRVKEDYGQEGEWWRGTPVSMAKIVSLGDASEEGTDGDKEKYEEFIAEVQRLMAFLSASDRSYGSAGALMQTEAMKNPVAGGVRSNTMLERFMQTWTVAAMSMEGADSGLANLFTTTVNTNASEGMEDTHLTLIDMPVDAGPGEGKQQDLFELLDGLLWDTSDPNISSDNYIERPAELLVMRLRLRNRTNDQKQLKVVAPPEFHLDKYLREHIETTRSTRAEIATAKQKVEKIEQIDAKLRKWKNPSDGKEIDASRLVGHSIRYFEEEDKLASSADESSQHADLTAKLSALMSSIDTKLATLASEKEKTLATITSLSRAPLPGLASEDYEHQYILRGVATKPNITYILAHEDDDAPAEQHDGTTTTEDVDVDDTTYPGMRWWRLEYEVQPSGLGAKVSKVKVGDYDVLRAIELEHDAALLVYGSIAVNSPPAAGDEQPLPPPLQAFVQTDNELLAAELETERNKPPAYQSFDMTGGDADKRASMDSTRVEGGGSPPPSPPDYEHDGADFERHPSFGLGPAGLKAGFGGGEGQEEVAEIRLDDEEEGVEEGEGREMVEKRGGGLMVGGEGGEREREVQGGDVEMGRTQGWEGGGGW